MLQTLENSERFRKDYDRYNAAIAEVTNDKVKSELTVLLSQLLREVRAIDDQHQELFTKGQMPSNIIDARSKITDIRKDLDRKLRDWTQASRQI